MILTYLEFMIPEIGDNIARGDWFTLAMLFSSLVQITVFVCCVFRRPRYFDVRFLRECILAHCMLIAIWALFDSPAGHFFRIDDAASASDRLANDLAVTMVFAALWMIIPFGVYVGSILLRVRSLRKSQMTSD